MWRLCETFRCTPREAERELEENPRALDTLNIALYERAYREYEKWESIPAEKRRELDLKPPSGGWADLVRRHRAEIVSEQMAERQRQRAERHG